MNIYKWFTNRKYRVFCRKIKDSDVAIWECDFKIAKSRYMRESARMERDKAMDAIHNVENALKGVSNKQEREKMEKDKEMAQDLVKKYEKQMEMIDGQIEGVQASETTLAQPGLKEVLENLVELRSMYKDYRDNL